VGLIWKNVELVDRKTTYDDATAETEGDDAVLELLVDDHDDTPILRKLFLFAKLAPNSFFAPMAPLTSI
jgi:hypothetical protein